MLTRTADPLALANSHCFCWTASTVMMTGVCFLVLALMGDFFTCQILLF